MKRYAYAADVHVGWHLLMVTIFSLNCVEQVITQGPLMWSNVKDIVAVYTSLILKGNFVIAQLPFVNTCRSLVVSNGHVFAKQTLRS